MNPDPITDPYRQGMDDYAKGVLFEDNPYPCRSTDWQWEDWREGWLRAEKASLIPRKT